MPFGYDPSAHRAVLHQASTMHSAEVELYTLGPFLPPQTPEWVRRKIERIAKDLGDARATALRMTEPGESR